MPAPSSLPDSLFAWHPLIGPIMRVQDLPCAYMLIELRLRLTACFLPHQQVRQAGRGSESGGAWPGFIVKGGGGEVRSVASVELLWFLCCLHADGGKLTFALRIDARLEDF